MTSKVVVTACCADTKYVEVRTYLNSQHTMQSDQVIERVYLENGQTKEVYIYDNRYVLTQELEKTKAGPV